MDAFNRWFNDEVAALKADPDLSRYRSAIARINTEPNYSQEVLRVRREELTDVYQRAIARTKRARQ